MPHDWGLELAYQAGIRQVSSSDDHYIYFSDRAELTFAVTVPTTALPGAVLFQASIAARENGGATSPVSILVNVSQTQ